MPKRPPQDRLDSLIAGMGSFSADLRRFGDEVTVGPWMVSDLRRAEAAIRTLRCQVEDRLSETAPRQCATCRRPVVTGRPDRKYCSDTCRQAAHRSRHDTRPGPSPESLPPSRRPVP